jgi:hypothetical protein
MASSLSIEVFNSGDTPIPAGPGWDAGMPANSSASGNRYTLFAAASSQFPS